MVVQNIVYQGDLRCEATHTPSQVKLVTDAPLDNMGKGESFSPTDLMATALSTCLITTMAIAARKYNLELGPCSATVEKHMATTSPRRIAKLVCHITASGIEDANLRKRIEAAAQACPVHQSLHPDVEQTITITWQDA